jgi:hypothetical protein
LLPDRLEPDPVTPPPAQSGASPVYDDSTNPGLEPAVSTKAGQSLPGRRERLEQHVFGETTVGRQADRQPERDIAVRSVEPRERNPITVAGFLDEIPVGVYGVSPAAVQKPPSLLMRSSASG